MLGLCVVTWFLLPRTLGLRRSRKTSGNLCHPSGEAAGVRRLASPLLLSPGVWEDTDTGGTHSRTAPHSSIAQSHTAVRCFPKPSFCSSCRAHPRMAGNPLISGSKTSTSIMNARDLSSSPRPESVPLSSSPLRLPEMSLPQVPAAFCQEVALPEAIFFFILLGPQMLQGVGCRSPLRKPALGLWS